MEDNLVDIVGNVESWELCNALCSENSDCNVFTYLGEENHFRRTCFLFSECEVFTEDCLGCTSGADACDVCKFENTMPDGSCAVTCDAGWEAFDDHCYLLMKNNENHYDDINVCRNECTALEGNLTSIHSKEENDFVFNLIEPNSESSYYGLTWLGASCIRSVCKWDDGTPWDFENWKPGFPINYNTYCVFLGDDNGTGLELDEWSNGVCNFSSEFDCVCKKIIK